MGAVVCLCAVGCIYVFYVRKTKTRSAVIDLLEDRVHDHHDQHISVVPQAGELMNPPGPGDTDRPRPRGTALDIEALDSDWTKTKTKIKTTKIERRMSAI